MKKTNIICGVFCGAMILVCLFFYVNFTTSAQINICTPYSYSQIEFYEGKVLEEMPEGYMLPYDMPAEELEKMKVVEIQYQLVGKVNDTTGILGNLCLYSGEYGEWVEVLSKDRNYFGASNYENNNIVPPGATVFYKEYVLVPKDMKEIYAYRVAGEGEEMIIRL